MTRCGHTAIARNVSRSIIGVVSAHGWSNTPTSTARARLGRFDARLAIALEHPRHVAVG